MKKIFLAVIIFFAIADSVAAVAIAPARFDELVFEPGEEIQEKFVIYNDEAVKKNFYFTAENFIAGSQPGKPEFTGNSQSGLASWITFPEKELILAPGAEREVIFTIAIPEEADPGGYYAAIFAISGNSLTQDDTIVQTSKVGILLLGKVPGEVEYKASLVDFKIDGADNKVFYSIKPREFSAVFKNSGNVHFRPEVKVNISNFFGLNKKTVSLNYSGGYLLPDSDRRFEGFWREKIDISGFAEKFINQIKEPAFGRYKAELVFSAAGETKISKQIIFWIIPYHLLILIAVFIVLLVLALKIYNKN